MRRKRRMYRALLWLTLAALLALTALAALRLWGIARDTARAERLLWQMRQTAMTFASSAVSAQSGAADSAASAQGGASESAAALPPNGAQSAAGEPPTPETGDGAHRCPVDFDALRAQYPDVTAWLTGCGGAIDTPVVQGADNAYYLDHLPDGTQNRLGAAFLDSGNSPDFSDEQSFLFGHHMDTGDGVFSPLLRYQDAAYAREYPAFVLHTPEGCYLAEVFAAFLVQERAYPYEREFASAEAMRAFLAEVRARSQIESAVQPAPGDRIVTLCTCASKTSDLRYVVCTRLMPLADA